MSLYTFHTACKVLPVLASQLHKPKAVKITSAWALTYTQSTYTVYVSTTCKQNVHTTFNHLAGVDVWDKKSGGEEENKKYNTDNIQISN